MSTRRRSTISNAVLNSREYGSNGNSPSQIPDKYCPSAYDSPVLTTTSQRSRFGMSSGGGRSSINIFNHDGQGTYSNPYEKPAGAMVAPQSFHSNSPFAGRPSMSREERYNQLPPSSSLEGANSNSTPSARSRLGQAGSSCIMGQSPSASTPVKPRGSSCGGGDSSNVASILSWSGPSSSSTTTPTSYGKTRSPIKSAMFERGATFNDLYGYGHVPHRRSAAMQKPSPTTTNPPAGSFLYDSASPYHYQPSVRVSRPPGGSSSWTPGWS